MLFVAFAWAIVDLRAAARVANAAGGSPTTAVAEAGNDFGFRLLRTLTPDRAPANVAVSPLSVSQALTMAEFYCPTEQNAAMAAGTSGAGAFTTIDSCNNPVGLITSGGEDTQLNFLATFVAPIGEALWNMGPAWPPGSPHYGQAPTLISGTLHCASTQTVPLTGWTYNGPAKVTLVGQFGAHLDPRVLPNMPGYDPLNKDDTPQIPSKHVYTPAEEAERDRVKATFTPDLMHRWQAMLASMAGDAAARPSHPDGRDPASANWGSAHRRHFCDDERDRAAGCRERPAELLHGPQCSGL